MNTNKLTKIWQLSFLIIAATIVTSCNNETMEADAYGNFEANETLVSAEAAGKIVRFTVSEGQDLELNQVVGLVDTIMQALQLNEINAQYTRVQANFANIDAQISVARQQKENLETDLKRIENMQESGAATQKQFDDVNGAIKVIDKNIEALQTQKQSIRSELKIIQSKELLLKEQLNKCHIYNPVKGTVIEKYAEQGEITAPGKPLYNIANLDQIILRAYISGAQLHSIKTNQSCKVRIDKGAKKFIEFDGTVQWIANEAEFTPKIIQTKEERVNMVYAIKILVKNDGSIKMGMPGEVIFN